jgi:DNA-directed RNA polymerase subunit N (RpoN/RPB10)
MNGLSLIGQEAVSSLPPKMELSRASATPVPTLVRVRSERRQKTRPRGSRIWTRVRSLSRPERHHEALSEALGVKRFCCSSWLAFRVEEARARAIARF